MTNPIANMKRTAADFRQMDKADKKRYVTDLVFNNALYILLFVFVIYTAIQKPNFLSLGSFANLVIQVAAYLPMALGIAGCIVLTGTDLSAGRISGLTAAVAGVFLQKTDFVNKMFTSLPEVNGWWIAATLLAVVAIGAVIG
ncbi:MAG: beta-methylgalactoside transporter, partial [Oscillospiraceae bacterium]|nr:beta-methylgalactoside transporter [Oscillospiraceae bacterium]